MMNLADIRKKAQNAEPPADRPDASRQAPAPASEPVAPAEPAAPAAPLAAPEPARYGQYQSGAEYPADLEFYPEPENFDPVAVILKGRQSAAFEEAASQEELAAASVELLCFRVATEEYAISIMDIKEIIKPREVTEVPRVPSFVRGILSLRGNIIPIFDMRVRLGLPEAVASERERVVVVKRQAGFCGVLVDEVVQVVRIAEAGIEPPPVVLEGIDRDFVQGIGRVGGRMLILLDMEKVLDVSLM